MSGQIIFFKKNVADIEKTYMTVTASQGNDFASRALNRSNLSAWITTGSVDADNTTWEVDMVDESNVTDILLIKHNFKAFTVKYWDGSTYKDFSPAINETTNTSATNWYQVSNVSTSKLKITITGTQTANVDKFLYQFIATEKIGTLSGFPVIKNPTHDENKKRNTMLSGKTHLVKNVGGFQCTLNVSEWKLDADLALVESLYGSVEGFLVWLCGGNENQFSSKRIGYRLEDIYLMKCVNEYSPEWVGGIYSRGLDISIKLEEVIT